MFGCQFWATVEPWWTGTVLAPALFKKNAHSKVIKTSFSGDYTLMGENTKTELCLLLLESS